MPTLSLRGIRTGIRTGGLDHRDSAAAEPLSGNYLDRCAKCYPEVELGNWRTGLVLLRGGLLVAGCMPLPPLPPYRPSSLDITTSARVSPKFLKAA